MLSTQSLKNKYEEMLLSAFPTEIESIEYFYPNTFYGDDESDYLNCMEIFQGKKWDEVNFEQLYFKYVQFLFLNENG